MKIRYRLLFAVIPVLLVPTLLRTGYATIVSQINASKQAMLENLLKPCGTSVPAQKSESVVAADEADKRRKAVIALEESRAQREALRRRSGDPTPTVEAVIATADSQFCALIGGVLVYEGNMMEGYRVQKIRAGSVEFEKNGKVWVQKIE